MNPTLILKEPCQINLTFKQFFLFIYEKNGVETSFSYNPMLLNPYILAIEYQIEKENI